MRITDRDMLTFEAIQRHGWLPSHYLHQFTKHIAKNETEQRKVLKRLVDAGYLQRPHSLNDPRVKNDFLNYALTEKAEAVLEMAGKRNRYGSPLSGGFAHAAMTVAITANIDLEATKAGVRFISQEEVLDKAPQKTLDIPASISYAFKNETQHSTRPTTPDQLFGLEYPTGYRFFAVEADRGMEPIEPTNLKANSILRKLLSYDYILRRGDYRKQLAIPQLFVLFVTTSEARASNMVKLAEKLFKRSNFMLFTHIPGFDRDFFKSPALLPRLWTRPWLRAGTDPFDISKA
jgi:hypothetical protein